MMLAHTRLRFARNVLDEHVSDGHNDGAEERAMTTRGPTSLSEVRNATDRPPTARVISNAALAAVKAVIASPACRTAATAAAARDD